MTRALALLAFAALLAGCSAPEAPREPTPEAPPPSAEEARALLAAGSAPALRQGVAFEAERNGTRLVDGEALVDHVNDTVHAQATLHPTLLASSPQASLFSQFAGGNDTMRIYLSPEAGALRVGDMVLLLSKEEADRSLGELTRPDAMLAKLGSGNVTIENVSVMRVDGARTIVIAGEYLDGRAPQAFRAFVVESPPRLARVETRVLEIEGALLSNATVVLEAVSPDALALPSPADMARALELRHVAERTPLRFGGSVETWTFQAERGPVLSEIVAEVGFPGRPTLWSMSLAEGARGEGGVSLRFNDLDADGRVSAGDALTIERDAARTFHVVFLRDETTGARVVPASGALLALAALCALAWAARGRR